MMKEKQKKILKNTDQNYILNNNNLVNSKSISQKNNFLMNDEEKIEKIEEHFFQIMETLGLDMNDDSLRRTPKRVAKMFIQEIFSGLNPKNTPTLSIFDNKYKYNQMLIEKNITVYSTCEHHFLPIVGKAHVGYISNGKVIGLSKINRIVNFYAKRPQVQERLTMQIVESLQKMLKTQDVACVIKAKHLCVNSRGIRDIDSSTVTTELVGSFKKNSEIRREFLHHIGIS
ncbi:GTP cyclohydrolase I [Blattabacterium sp. (Blattella germanica) str. Bge]|uniref:GTP cyclohydrolase I FolE n=1 Tax=Blattabacterium sp. (Blattella germanica) TaxID=624186 RepID=UPI0001BB6270|nr:GTP cyclohydrolase I FolE [Blattabacterium sp. (Blattella germanica)]ACY40570.1 GTP cyclohydrolase I [Blattabacterium sp. (Blattella germanica) str. Bge]